MSRAQDGHEGPNEPLLVTPPTGDADVASGRRIRERNDAILPFALGHMRRSKGSVMPKLCRSRCTIISRDPLSNPFVDCGADGGRSQA